MCSVHSSPHIVQVIVGANGSGKSTILKLVVRLYDPDEGQILLDGHDIRTLRMYDLRQAVSVLFQDYTHFPFSVRDPPHAPFPSEYLMIFVDVHPDPRQHRPGRPVGCGQ